MSKLTNTQKSILDADTQALIGAGFLSSDLKITEDATYYLRHLAFIANKTALIARANEIIAEKAKKVQVQCAPCETADDDAE